MTTAYPSWFASDQKYKELYASWKQVFPSEITDKPEFNDSNHVLDKLLTNLPNHLIDAIKNSSSHIDREEFIENAARLDAILRLYPERLAIVGRDNLAVMHQTKEPVPLNTECVYVGLFLEHESTGQKGVYQNYKIRQTGDANKYMDSKTFAKYAGREVTLCGIDVPAGQTDVVVELAQMKAAGLTRAFIKARKTKYGVYDVDLSGDNVESALWDAMGFAAEHLAERPNQLLLQEHVNMEYEYRIIVIDHKPVCGAGCVENFTPIHNEHIFDAKMQRYRAGGEIDYDVALVNQYRRLAYDFCAELAIEQPDIQSYSLDVCMIDGKPSVVELNSFHNLGLYAMDVEEMIEYFCSHEFKESR